MMSEDQTMRTSRLLPYSPAAIYRAFVLPALLAQWWGPEGFTNTFEVFEFKPGGQWRFVMHGPDGKHYANENVFAALEPDRMVVIEHRCVPFFTLTIKLSDVANGTQLSWEQVFADAETARTLQPIVVHANEQNLDRLTRVLSKLA